MIDIMVAVVIGIVAALVIDVVIACMIGMRVEGQRMYCAGRRVVSMGVRRRSRDDAKMRQGDSHTDRNDPANSIHVLFLTAFVTRHEGVRSSA